MGLTVQEMHIGIDLGLQQLNSNLFNKIVPEAKDYAINAVLYQYISGIAEDARNAVANEVTYTEIRKFYNQLEPLDIQLLRLLKRWMSK